MLRMMGRFSAVAAVVLALGLTLVSPVSARPTEIQRPTAVVTTQWITAAWTWVQGLLAGGAPRSLSANELAPTVPDGTVYVNTGSCIDPWGHRVPCSPK